MKYSVKTLIYFSLAYFLLMSSSAWSSASCLNNEHHVCDLPFELIYSEREKYAGSLVRVEGVIIISEGPLIDAYIFPSKERALYCNMRHAVRLNMEGGWTQEQRELLDGRAVSASGALVSESDRYGWAMINLRQEPSPISGLDRLSRHCLSTLEPPPPEPVK